MKTPDEKTADLKQPRAKSFNIGLDSRFLGLLLIGLLLFAWGLFEVYGWLLFKYSKLPGLGLRYLLVPVFVLLLSLLIEARYIQDIFEMKSFSLAFRYLAAMLFGFSYPRLLAAEGEKKLKKGEVNLLDLIGGPGYLVVQPGNVVLLESLGGPLRVLSAGRHFINRYESIKEIITLEERHGQISQVSARSIDGIEVILADVHFRYRIYADPETSLAVCRSLNNPFPYCDDAVLNMAYNRTFTAEGITSWHETVTSAIDAVITEYIQRHTVDQLTAPSFAKGDHLDPRGEIYKKLESPSTRERLKALGAELVWCEIGHFEIPDKQVSDQRLNRWQARWRGNAEIVRSYSEAQRAAYEDIGRAEGQAEVLMSVLHALDDVDLQGDSRQRIRNVILMRTAQIIEAMSLQNPPR